MDTSGAEPAVTTSLLHHPLRHLGSWWKSAVIAEVPGDLNAPQLRWLTSQVAEFADCGCDAVILRPSRLDFSKDLNALEDFLAASHAANLRVIITVAGLNEPVAADLESCFSFAESDLETTRRRAFAALEAGADGIDVGLLPLPALSGGDCALSEITKLVAAIHHRSYQLSARSFVSAFTLESDAAAYRDLLDRYLFLHLRDATLLDTPWSAAELTRRIGNAFAVRDPLGHVGAWRALSILTESNRQGFPQAWFNESADVRRRALTLLSLALPGAVYIRASRLLEIPWVEGTLDLTALPPQERDDARATVARAQQLRASLQIGTGSAAVISGVSWANQDCFILAGSRTLTVVNTTNSEVDVPDEYHPLLTSKLDPDFTAPQMRRLEPGECGWYAFADSSPGVN